MHNKIISWFTLIIVTTNCNTELFDTSQRNSLNNVTTLEFVLEKHNQTDFENVNDAIYNIINLNIFNLSKLDSYYKGNTPIELLYNEGNVLISPFSYGVAVAQTLLGAGGWVRDILKYILHAQKEEDVQEIHKEFYIILKHFRDIDEEFNLTAGSGLFLDPSLTLKNAFVQNLRAIYNTDIIPVNFRSSPSSALREINSWCDSHTNGLTGPLLQSVPDNIAALMANTIYFDADWVEPFSYRLTRPGIFYQTPTEPVNITYLQCEFEEMLYAENESMKSKILRMPYVGKNGVSMYILLPTEGNDINKILPYISKESINNLIRSMKKHSVTVSIPKLNMRSRTSLKNIVTKIKDHLSNVEPRRVPIDTRYPELFTMPFASDDNKFVIHDIVQQLSMNINEKGTTASVVTSTIFDLDGNSISFRVSKPYIFFIQHERTGAILFWGKIDNPNL